MMHEFYHIYNRNEMEPLYYYENDDDEFGRLIYFTSHEAAEKFIEDTIAESIYGEAFFADSYIALTVEYCDAGYLEADGCYIGDDTKIHKWGE